MRIGSGNTEGATVNVKKKETLDAGKILSVPGRSWVHLGFVIGGNKPDKPLVRMNKQERLAKYKFPCSGAGNFTIAWLKTDPRNGSKSQACKNATWKVEREKHKTISSLPVFDKASSSVLTYKTKQNNKQNEQQSSGDLEITPGQSQNLIQTRSAGTYTFTDFGSCNLSTGRCTDSSGTIDLGTCSIESIERGRCTNKIETVEDITVVDVILGDISVKSEDDSTGTPVKQGESYLYPGGEIKPIDVASKSNSCEIQQFLNPFYWNNPDVPKSVMDGVYEQLKEHREALRISGRDEGKLSPLERGVVDEMDLARTAPAAYADFLEKGKQKYIQFAPKEGASAVNEAVAFLRSTSSRPAFHTSVGMSRASKDHAKDQEPTGRTGHTGTDGSEMQGRMERYGNLGSELGCGIAENISYGLNAARDVVMQLIIDDGQRERGHRENIFNPDHQVVGVGCGSHAKYDSMCVIDYAGGYIERS